jgi:hypothetical protein
MESNMGDELIIYESGVRSDDGKYSKFIESPSKSKVDDYIEIMKSTVSDSLTIVYYEKTYRCISTIPQIIRR